MIAKAMGFLETHVQPSGGIYPKSLDMQANYLTSIALVAFVEANENGKYKKTIDDAVKFVKGFQWSETAAGGAKVGPEDHRYGGFGYGSKARPDLSNTSFAIDALTTAGVPKDDPALQRAITFLRRCQNFTGEGGNDKFSGSKADADGGFGYTPNESMAGKTPEGGLRSYASMTYAGFKSMIHAGLSKDDPRLKAALAWIRKHYTLDENPGMGQAGLFYYFQTFSKALAIAGIEKLEGESGAANPWREQLVDKLVAKQKEDGSWANSDKRWLEDNAALATGYALLALGQATR
jgi:squalene-hopene/tetraprenyl-beta-curcumene cyclase